MALVLSKEVNLTNRIRLVSAKEAEVPSTMAAACGLVPDAGDARGKLRTAISLSMMSN